MTWDAAPPRTKLAIKEQPYRARVVDLDEDDAPTIASPRSSRSRAPKKIEARA